MVIKGRNYYQIVETSYCLIDKICWFHGDDVINTVCVMFWICID